MLPQITTIPESDYYLDFHTNTFNEYEPLAKIDNLTLVQQVSETKIEYGLLDEQNRVAGYFRIVKFNDEIWETTTVYLAHAYTGCGYGTFFHDFVVMNQKKKLISDNDRTNYTADPQSYFWKHRLETVKTYSVIFYNTKSGEIKNPSDNPQLVEFDNNIRYLAIPPDETIQEQFNRIQAKMRRRTLVWYGRGSTSKHYFNF